MKKYTKPASKVLELKQQQMICASPLPIYNTPPTPGDPIPTTIDQW